MVGSVVFGQYRQIENKSDKFRQTQTNRTKSLIHPSLTYPPWRHVVQINRLRYSLLPAQTSSECLPQCSVCFGFSQLWHLGGISLLCSLLRVSISISAPVALRTRWRRRLRMRKPLRMREERWTRSCIEGLTNSRFLNQGVSWSQWTQWILLNFPISIVRHTSHKYINFELFHIQARQCMWNNFFTYVCEKNVTFNLVSIRK